ncbi:MAG: phosphatidate cytidylyltransferase [Thermocladium sp.]
MSRIARIKALLYRKLFHLILSVFLIAPFIIGLQLQLITYYYLILLFLAAMLYATQLKRPIISLVISEALDDARQSFRDQLIKILGTIQRGGGDEVIITFNKLESMFNETLKNIERDYEKRGGYLGVLMGAIGVYASYTAFGSYAAYGILALIFYDTFSALIGTAIGRHKLPYSTSTIEGSIGGLAIYMLVLLVLGLRPIDLAALGAAVVVSEAYGVEDNLTIPLIASLVAFLLGTPTTL